MLRKPLIVFLILLNTLSLAAQQPFKTSTYVGFHVDKTLNYVYFKPTVNQDILQDKAIGLILRHISEPHIGIQLEVNYGGRGWIENRDSAGTYRRDLTYLDIPVTAIFVAGSKHLRMAFNLGPDVSFLRGEKETVSIADTAYSYDYYGKPIGYNWNFGLIAGLSFEWHTRFGAFGIHGTYYFFLPNLFSLRDEVFYYETSKPQSIDVGISYIIKIF